MQSITPLKLVNMYTYISVKSLPKFSKYPTLYHHIKKPVNGSLQLKYPNYGSLIIIAA